MTELGLNAGAARSAGRAVPFSRGRHASPLLRSGVSLLALLAYGLASPANAENFEVTSEVELNQAILKAQANADPASTITLKGSFALTAAPSAIAGKDITIVTGDNTLSYGSTVSFSIASGASLKLTGKLQGAGVLSKTGAGQLVIDNATGSGVTHIGLNGGHTLIEGGSEVTFGTSTNGTTEQLDIAGGPGQVASLTISGAGTKLVATGTDQIDLSNGGSGAQSTLTIEAGASFTTAGAIRLHSPSSVGTATVNVIGAGSSLAAVSFGAFGGSNSGGTSTSSIKVLDGAVVKIRDDTSFGGLGNTAMSGVATVEVSGEGSRWETGGALTMLTGSLSILGGGVVTAATVNIATSNRGPVPSFAALVSGAGSELRAATMTVGTTGTGILTIANDGKVVVGGGTAALALGGLDADSNAALNIGGAVGEAAAAAGALEASAITLAASAEINFNHTETGYVFGLPINGSGAINQVAGRTIFDADQLGFSGLTTISGGMLEVNGKLGGPLLRGTVNVLGGTLAGTGFVGNTSLAAGGSIAPGQNGIGQLTIEGDYAGSGGLLQIETVLGDDGSDTDLLKIAGNSTGTTNLKVTNLGGGGGLTGDAGIKLIDVGGTSTGTFTLLGDTVYDGQQAVIGGAYLYGLHQGTVTVPDGDWYLRSILDPDQIPVFQPAAPVIETYAAAALQAFNTTESLQQRIGNRSWSGGTEGNGIWGRIDARHTSLGPDDSTTGASYEVDTWRLQAGADGVLTAGEAGSLVGGVNLQVGTISADISSASGDGGIEGTAFGLGGALTWYGKSGFYLDLQGKLNWFDSTLTADLLDAPLVSGNAGFGTAVSLEAGQQLALGGGWSITPQAQLAYSSVDFASFESYASTVALQSGDSLLGRLGLSADYETEWQDPSGEAGRSHLYGVANLTYEFLDGMATSIGADTLVNEADPLWGSIGLGGTVNWAGDALSLYGEANVGTSLSNVGNSYTLGVTAGLRGKF